MSMHGLRLFEKYPCTKTVVELCGRDWITWFMLLACRFPWKCFCLCHCSCRSGTCGLQCLLLGQTASLWLWPEAPRGWRGFPPQTSSPPTGGHEPWQGDDARRPLGAPARWGPWPTRLLGMGGLQSWCGLWGEIFQGLPRFSGDPSWPPIPYEASQQPCWSAGK